ncbi:Protein of unknown function [Cotesia congregata]|uniref:CCHC-type domain-containing protein n=1 Tax=Cotesia congregata TaxID=51543 RepID=A0A8J2E0G8_COTCN|nr:Protein of unknown function [Cotesia congregata]
MEGAVRVNEKSIDSMKNKSAHPADSTQSTPTVRRSSRLNRSKSISRSADMLHPRDGSEEEIRLTRAQAEKQRKEIEIELRRTVGQQIRAEFEEEIRKREEEAAREQGLERAEEKLLSWWDDYTNVHRVARFERLARTELEKAHDVNTVYRKNRDIGNISRRIQGPKESAKDYILNLQTLMRRHGKMSDMAKLERLYHNLRPEYKRYIKRAEFDSVSGLIKSCDDYDQLIKQEASYKPPKQHSVMSVTMKTSQGRKNHKPTNPIVINRFDHHQSCWRCGEQGHIQRGCRNQRVVRCTHPEKKRY